MNKKPLTKVSVKEAFEIGKLQGSKETIDEILDLMKDGIKGEALKSYLKGRSQGLVTRKLK